MTKLYGDSFENLHKLQFNIYKRKLVPPRRFPWFSFHPRKMKAPNNHCRCISASQRGFNPWVQIWIWILIWILAGLTITKQNWHQSCLKRHRFHLISIPKKVVRHLYEVVQQGAKIKSVHAWKQLNCKYCSCTQCINLGQASFAAEEINEAGRWTDYERRDFEEIISSTDQCDDDDSGSEYIVGSSSEEED